MQRLTLPPHIVRKAQIQLTNPRFPFVAFVRAGANERDFAIKKGLLEMLKLNPETKATTEKLLGDVVEKLTTMLVLVKDAEVAADAPATMPDELSASLSKIVSDFATAFGALVPESAPPAPAEPPAQVAPVEAAEPSAEEKLQMTIEQLEGFIAELKKGGVAKSTIIDSIAKTLTAKATAVALVAKAAEAKDAEAVAKGMNIKRNVMASMKVYNDGFSKFLQLLLELLPLVMAMQDANVEVTDPTLAPAAAQPGGADPPDPNAVVVEEMGKKMAKEMAEVGKAVKKGIDEAVQPLVASIAAIKAEVETVAKSRPAPANLNDDIVPGPVWKSEPSINELANERLKKQKTR